MSSDNLNKLGERYNNEVIHDDWKKFVNTSEKDVRGTLINQSIFDFPDVTIKKRNESYSCAACLPLDVLRKEYNNISPVKTDKCRFLISLDVEDYDRRSPTIRCYVSSDFFNKYCLNFSYSISDEYSDQEISDFFRDNPESNVAYGLVWNGKHSSASPLTHKEDTTVYSDSRSNKVTLNRSDFENRGVGGYKI